MTTWEDSSSAGLDYGQTSAGNKPTYKVDIVNNHEVVRFATDDSLTGSPTNRTLSAANTLVAVCTPDSGSGYIISGNLTGGCPAFISGFNNGGVKAFEYFHGNGTERLVFASSASGFHILTVTRTDDSGNVVGYFDGTQVFSQAVITTDWNTVPITRIGTINGAASDFFDGDVAELIHYSRVLNSTELTNLHNYLK